MEPLFLQGFFHFKAKPSLLERVHEMKNVGTECRLHVVVSLPTHSWLRPLSAGQRGAANLQEARRLA
ncbi:MAG: hypothetical protein EAS52_07900 [Parapedobacter sp.]|nr:MAG: hypothetical protein EAS52_07900 [Parapedobacter sp.]